MKGNRIIVLMCLLLLSAAVSCSVKEDRSVCPCRLRLDFSGTDTSAVPGISLLLSDSGRYRCKEELPASDFMPEYMVEVPRTDIFVNVFAGNDLKVDPDKGLTIPVGSQCPLLNSCHLMADASGEESYARVELYKNHCVMSITVRKNDALKYGLCVKGNICGYGIDGTLLEGDFLYEPDQGADGAYMVVLPRQKDASLKLEVDDGTDVLKTFALGEYVASCGYDWNDKDLKDIEVTIDWAQTKIMLAVKGWDQVKEYEIVI